ncbi:MAG: SUF system NifU family Fe-S cluster assembly protein [Gammaproteobacteria bacterium]|nr:SUF system NifU family Fe-S cluster assembly protein [Gammaproteobacteria bacterium]
MSALRQLYQEMIIDHGKRPRNFGTLPDATHHKEGFNPLCGDRLTIYVSEKNNVVEKICFEGSGCAISVASASLMTEVLQGKTRAEVEAIFDDFHELVTKGHNVVLEDRLGKLAVLAGVAEFPARVKCAILAWHTLKAAMADDAGTVSTE